MKTIHITSPQAQAAIYAASHGRKAWGKHNARAYAIKHGAGSLYTLACILAVSTDKGI